MDNILEKRFYPALHENFFQSLDFTNALKKIGWKTTQAESNRSQILGFAPKSFPVYSELFPRFLVLYGPIFSGDIDSRELDDLLKKLCQGASKEGAVTLDIRTPFPHHYCNGVFEENGFHRKIEGGEYSALTDLSKTEDELLKNLNQNSRRCVRRAIKFDVIVKGVEDESDLLNFYNVYAETGRRRGFYPFPYTFFEVLWKELEPKKKVKLFTAYCDEKPSAIILNTFNGEESVPYIMGSLNEYWKYHPNHLLVWHSMIWSKDVVGSSFFKLYHLPKKRNFDAEVDYYSFKASFGGKIFEECAFYEKVISNSKNFLSNSMKKILKSFVINRFTRVKPM
ncbi:putative methicillin resistance protein [Thaumarchaeota archaeon SCGC AB-539-E09]|nr:putative methicillin resistance protein [Thaumarchaeota archaeon SCGC AB-539-E09]